ncbi:MAG TPA: ThuA domain-containing protein [Planctomycetota bacterium]|nr:ThuA domain-containing protein [Planctomycetota bacterium]
MNRRDLLIRSSAAAAALSLFRFPLGWADDGQRRKLLFFTKSSGFEHSSIKRKKGADGKEELSHAEKVVTDLGAKHNFDVTCTKDGTIFTAEKLAPFDAFLFYTTGDLTKPGTDKNPPMTPEGKAAFLDAIKNGKGFAGTHSASDTFHSPGNENHSSARFKQDGDGVDPYVAMLGAEFIVHGAQQKAKMKVVDSKFPGMAEAKEGFEMMEEWYSLKNHAKNLHVLLVNETDGMKGNMYARPPFPATWAREHGKGRVFYTSMGHREEVWTNPVFQSIFLGGLSWAFGNVKADVPPNLDTVTPQYAETGKEDPPKPPKAK